MVSVLWIMESLLAAMRRERANSESDGRRWREESGGVRSCAKELAR